MTTKKIFGYLFMLCSVILALAVVGQLQRLFQETIDFFRVFTGAMDAYESSKAITKFVLWVIHVTLVFVLWNYGRKWTQKPSAN